MGKFRDVSFVVAEVLAKALDFWKLCRPKPITGEPLRTPREDWAKR